MRQRGRNYDDDIDPRQVRRNQPAARDWIRARGCSRIVACAEHPGKGQLDRPTG
jgi:hypothetical protein